MLERTGKSVDWLPGERVLADLLPGPGKSAVIDKTHSPGVELTLQKHQQELTALYEKTLFSRNRGSHAAGMGIAVIVVAAMIMQEAPVAVLIAVIVLMLVLLALFARWLPAYSVQGRKLQDAIQGLRQYLGVAEKDDSREDGNDPHHNPANALDRGDVDAGARHLHDLLATGFRRSVGDTVARSHRG